VDLEQAQRPCFVHILEMTSSSRAVRIPARPWPTIIQHRNALRALQVRLVATRTSQAVPTKEQEETLPWPRYLAVRKAKRRWELVSWSRTFNTYTRLVVPSRIPPHFCTQKPQTYCYLPGRAVLPLLGLQCSTSHVLPGAFVHYPLIMLTALLLFSGDHAS
jgi:hypothetical protein